jgi:hypothetical protein
MVSLSVILLFVLPAAAGIAALAALHLFKEKVVLTLAGAISGLAVFVFATYAIMPLIPLGRPLLLGLLLAATAVAATLLARTSAWNYWKKLPIDHTGVAILLVLAGLFALIAPKLLFARPDGLYTGLIHTYGDVGWHMANITNLQANRSFAPESPILGGTHLTYPFLSNLFSAALLVTGATFTQTIGLPALVLIPLTITLLYCLTRELTSSKRAGIIALLLFLFGGSTFGWLQLPDDWATSGKTFIEFATHLTRIYTGDAATSGSLHFINPITSLLLPQRSFLFGMPLALTILLILQQRRPGKSALIAAGVLAGLLPLFHAHTALALIPAVILLFNNNPSKQWFYFFTAAVVAGIPSLYYYSTGIGEPGTFLSYKPGWMTGTENWLLFWLKNSGLLVPAALGGLLIPAPKRVKALAAAGLIIFSAANIWLFAVWEWDNTKLFVYWLLFTLPLISYLADRLLRHPLIAVRGTVIALIIFHLGSGALDIFQLALPSSAAWQEWDTDSIALAEDINRLTRPGDIILAAPIHNSPIALTGRPVYLGYPGHVWTHGDAFWQREAATKDFLVGQITSLPEATPRYVVVGPVERSKYPDLKIAPDWQLIAQQGNYQFYKLPELKP